VYLKKPAESLAPTSTESSYFVSKTQSPQQPKDYANGFDPMSPDSPGVGDGLPLVRHSVYDCIELCADDQSAGLLLFKLIFYCRRALLTIDGKRWYVRSRESLCVETRLTRHQYDRALNRLRIGGFVETRRVPFSKMHIFGNKTTFRVTLKAIESLKVVVNYRGPVKSKKEIN
jgi:hypothetical protein